MLKDILYDVKLKTLNLDEEINVQDTHVDVGEHIVIYKNGVDVICAKFLDKELHKFVGIGQSKCLPDDDYNEKLGTNIAVKKLLRKYYGYQKSVLDKFYNRTLKVLKINKETIDERMRRINVKLDELTGVER